MTGSPWLTLGAFLAVLLVLARPLGRYMARVYEGRPCGLDRVLGPVERLLYRLAGVRPDEETGWKAYALAMLVFQAAGLVLLYALQELQGALPLNPDGMAAVPHDLAFNTAVSFVTNTNWQAYGGESTMSHLTQAAGLAVQNFLSAATGMAILLPLVRGFARSGTDRVGNFWVDLVRTTLYVLLPLSLLLAVLLVSQGVPQTLSPALRAEVLDPAPGADGKAVAEQAVAVGPVASQVAIKQLGTNGGGYYNVNSSHPLENPTPVSNFLEALAILLIPAALCFTFGRMVGAPRQGLALLAAMLVLFVPLALGAMAAERGTTPALSVEGVDASPGPLQGGGNMEGKEARFTTGEAALWSAATTAASNGSVNSMHDSYAPLGGLVPMVLMQLGEVVFGGVGSGLYGLVVFAVVAVFAAGLMVGRTPEYLRKKIGAFEMKMASLAVLAPCLAVLLGTAIAVSTGPGRAGVFNPGPHGFSEVLYGFSSAGNNNGSAFAGLGANTVFYNVSLGVAMLVARYGCAVPVLAIAGSLARKRRVAEGPGTLPTDGPLFVVLLVAVVLIVGVLTFAPALALGPVAEHLAAAR
jgi:K+-transporting ATPase ATPase A chain